MYALFMELEVVFSGHQDIVHIYDQPPFSYLFGKDCILHCLEGGRRISQSKEHDSGFKQPLVRDECCFMFVAFFDAYIVVPPSDVYFGKFLCILYVCYELGDQG